jgi:hypothetical protein
MKKVTKDGILWSLRGLHPGGGAVHRIFNFIPPADGEIGFVRNGINTAYSIRHVLKQLFGSRHLCRSLQTGNAKKQADETCAILTKQKHFLGFV